METHVSGNRVPVFSLGERIRKAREDLGLSQLGFAVLLGVDRKTVSNWEGGRNRPRYGDLMLIASVTDVSLQWLAADEFRSHPVSADTVVVDGRNSEVSSPSNGGYVITGAGYAAEPALIAA